MITVFNPTKEDFVCYYNNEKLPVAKSMEFTRYDDEVGEHVRKHLTIFVVNRRGIKHTDEERIRKISEEVANA